MTRDWLQIPSACVSPSPPVDLGMRPVSTARMHEKITTHDTEYDPRNAAILIWVNGELKPRAEALPEPPLFMARWRELRKNISWI
mgnify:CR=1 FL=1